MTEMHWAVPLIGLPYDRVGEGPDAFHCWSFVRHVQAAHYGRELPEIPNPEDLLTLAKAFRDHPERARWDEVDAPADGDCVLMRQSKVPVHVGVWIAVDGGRVLHCAQPDGVVCQTLHALRLFEWRIEGYYRFNGGAS